MCVYGYICVCIIYTCILETPLWWRLQTKIMWSWNILAGTWYAVTCARLYGIRANQGNVIMTSSNGNISALLAICAGNSPVPSEFPAHRPVTRSFDVFFDLRLNKRLSKNRETGDLRRHRAHYDVIVMCLCWAVWYHFHRPDYCRNPNKVALPGIHKPLGYLWFPGNLVP